MVDLVWNTNDNQDPEQEPINPSNKNLTVCNETPSRRESLLSPRRTVSKQIRGINGKLNVCLLIDLLKNYLHIIIVCGSVDTFSVQQCLLC